MIRINVKEANKRLGELAKGLTDKQLAIAVNRSINRSLMKGRTVARQAVKDEYNIPQKNLDGINVKKSTTQKLEGNVYASTKPIPMDAFAPIFNTPYRSIRVTKRGQQQVRERKRQIKNLGVGTSIEVHRGSRVVIPFAFMLKGYKPRVFARGDYATVSGGGFIRRYKREENQNKNDRVTNLISVNVYGAVINHKSLTKIERAVSDYYPKEAERQIRYMISKTVHNGS